MAMRNTDKADYLQEVVEEIAQIAQIADKSYDEKEVYMRRRGVSDLHANLIGRIQHIAKTALEDIREKPMLWIEKSGDAVIKAGKAEEAIEITKRMQESDDPDKQRYGIQREVLLQELGLWPEEYHDGHIGRSA